MSAVRFDHDLPISSIRGRWQIPALTWVTRVLLVVAIVGAFAPSTVGTALQIGVVATAIAVPLLRVVWLIHRWRQEHDWIFVRLGLALLVVIGAGALISLI
jgi:4-hydroxybenzoate polyprenyltransferase